MKASIPNIQKIVKSGLTSKAVLIPHLFRLKRASSGSLCSKFALTIGNLDEYQAYLMDLGMLYVGSETGILSGFEHVAEYDGTDSEFILQYLDVADERIADVVKAVEHAEIMAEPDWIDNWKLAENAKGFMLDGQCDGIPLTLFFFSSGIRELRHSFLHTDGVFKALKGEMLCLPTRVDAIRIGTFVYFLSKLGQSMLLSAEAIRQEARKTVDCIVKKGVIQNAAAFRQFASKGNNVRRLLRYNEMKLSELSDVTRGEKLRKTFGIHFQDGKLSIENQQQADQLIKVICDRGMTDPFADIPMEVSGARKWGM